MLKSTININDIININNFSELLFLIQKKSVVPKKSRTLLGNQIQQFLEEADEVNHLLVKVIEAKNRCTCVYKTFLFLIVLIFEISSAMRRKKKLAKLTVKNIEDQERLRVVHIPDCKTHQERAVTITYQEYI